MGTPEIPLEVGVALAHAAMQVVAESGIDMLHIKGPTVSHLIGDASVRSHKQSLDVDVWVRPEQSAAFGQALEAAGWRLKSPISNGSSFEHAATYAKSGQPSVDVHQTFPGIGVDGDTAFSRLWKDRARQTIAGIDCTIPSPTAQRLILLLNAARGRDSVQDRSIAWDDLDEGGTQELRDLARELKAEVALAAAIGELDKWTNHREHDLWLYLSSGTGNAFQMWWARVKAEGSFPAGVRRGFRLVFPTPQRVALESGRQLTGRELIRAYLHRFVTLAKR